MTGEEIKVKLEEFKRRGEVAAYSVTETASKPAVQVSFIGHVSDDAEQLLEDLRRQDILAGENRQPESFHFLGGELRPGAGIIRRVGGRPDGPSGTLTCLLSSKDSQDLYFLASGHVITNFWKPKSFDYKGSIYLNRQGFPGTNSMRSLGKIYDYSPAPPKAPYDEKENSSVIDIDIGIVKIQGEFDLRQRTTCYGNFGEWPSKPKDVVVKKDQMVKVMKCGAEETHWTAAVVVEDKRTVMVYGPDGAVYVLRNQIILEQPPDKSEKQLSAQQDPLPPHPCAPPARQGQSLVQQLESADPLKELPNNSPETPFAVAGDSGTMVVDKDSKRPVGMLVAGSILDGRYVMTPISAIWDYWETNNFVLRRA